MIRILVLAALLFASVAPAAARQAAFGWCELGGQRTALSGLNSSTYVQASYPSCTVTVRLESSGALATIYADSLGTPLANPFIANQDASWLWFADNNTYTVTLTGGGLPAPVLLPWVLLNDPSSGGGVVNSVFGRTGTVIAQIGDYAVAQVTGAAPTLSPVFTGTVTFPITGSTQCLQVNSTGALSGTGAACGSGGGGGAVTSVFGRSGTVVALTGDYTVSQVTGAAPLMSPALVGTPTAPTPSLADSSALLATTAFVKSQGYLTSAVASFNTRTGTVLPASGDYTVAQVTGAAPLASPTFSGTPAAPTPASTDNSTRVATTSYVKSLISALPTPITFTGTPLVGQMTQVVDSTHIQGIADLPIGAATGTSLVATNGPNSTTEYNSFRIRMTVAGPVAGTDVRDIQIQSANGSLASPTATLAGNKLGCFGSTGYTGAIYPALLSTSLCGFAAENWGASNNGTFATIANFPLGSPTQIIQALFGPTGAYFGLPTPTSGGLPSGTSYGGFDLSGNLIATGTATLGGQILLGASAPFELSGPVVSAPTAPAASFMRAYFKSGAGLCAKDAANVEYCPGGTPSSGYVTIQEEGASLTQRPTLNFIGASITCADDSGNVRTNCTVSAGGSTLTVNGSSAITSPNLNNTTPSPPAGNVNCTWAVTGSNISCYTPAASLTLNGGSPISSPNFSDTTPAAGAGFVNGQWQSSGANVSVRIPLGTSSSTAAAGNAAFTLTTTAPLLINGTTSASIALGTSVALTAPNVFVTNPSSIETVQGSSSTAYPIFKCASGAASSLPIVDFQDNSGNSVFTAYCSGQILLGRSGSTANMIMSGTAANTDSIGRLAFSASTTSATFTFAGTYTTVPACSFTPEADPGSGVRIWSTTSTTQAQFTASSAITLTGSYKCGGFN